MQATETGRCYIAEKEKIAHNIRLLRSRVGERKIYAVLKANGYGLGSAALASVCAENGLDRFAVSDLRQAKDVEESVENIRELLLMSAPVPEQIPEYARLGVTFTASSIAQLQQLPHGAKVHIKVDTGLCRRGFSWEAPDEITSAYSAFPGLSFTGIYTHFIDGGDKKLTDLQVKRFRAVLAALEKAGIDPGTRHCCGSSAVFGPEENLLDGVRVGTALLGRVPGGEKKYGLQPTGFCRVPIEFVRTVPKGATVGYSAAFRAKKEMQLALCPIGTHNGFGVVASSGCETATSLRNRLLRQLRTGLTGNGIPGGYIGGKFCPVVGRIFTEAVLLDVTGLDCKAGDEAIFNINPIMRHDMPVELI